MKNFILLGLLALLPIGSCSDNDNTNYVPNDTIINEWTVLKSSGTIAGITHEFPNGTILWKFQENNTVTIVNNNTNNNLQSAFPSSTYSYSVSINSATANCDKKIIIDGNNEFQCLVINDMQLDIEQGVADGINYHFERLLPFTSN